MKNKENTDGNKKQINEKIENDHSKKDSTEPLQENVDKNTQEQDVNNNKKEEEIISTNPVIETITKNDYNEPVSYTHLDVYKRQKRYFTISIL